MSENQNQSPAGPSSQEKSEIADYYDGLKQLEMHGYETGVKKARTALFVTAVLIFAGELISVAMTGLPLTGLVIGIALIEAGIFVGLAFWTKTKPHMAIIAGLIVFVGLWLLAIALSGFQAAYSGIIVRIIIIGYLISALKPAKAWEDAKKNL